MTEDGAAIALPVKSAVLVAFAIFATAEVAVDAVFDRVPVLEVALLGAAWTLPPTLLATRSAVLSFGRGLALLALVAAFATVHHGEVPIYRGWYFIAVAAYGFSLPSRLAGAVVAWGAILGFTEVAVEESFGMALWTGLGIAGSGLVVRQFAVWFRAAAEEKQRDWERLQALVESLATYTFVVGPRGTITYVSENTEEVTGYRSEDLIGRRPSEFVHPDDLEAVETFAPAAVVGTPGAIYGARSRVRFADGSWHHIEYRAVNMVDDPRVGGYVVGVHDVSDRLELARALERSEARFASLVESAPLGIVEFDLDARIRTWNPAAMQITGWRSEEVLDRSVQPGELGDTLLQVVRSAADDRSVVGIMPHTRRDGSRVELEFATGPVHDGRGEVTGVMGVFADVTERRRLMVELVEHQKASAVARLASGVAHDFANILTSFVGHAERLAAAAPTDAGEDVAGIRRAAQQASRLVAGLVAVGRPGAACDAVDACEAIVELSPLIHSVVGPDVEVSLDVPALPLDVPLTRTAFEQVVLNLVLNARDAMPEGGELCVAVVPPEPGGPPRVMHLVVSDTGVGMDAATCAKAFEAFFTTKPPGCGSGLGLPTVRTLVKRVGGRVTAVSSVGTGTCVTVALPIRDLTAAPDVDLVVT